MDQLTNQEGLSRAEREKRAYDEDGVWESSDKWHSRFPHVFFSPNSTRYEKLFFDLITDRAAGKSALEIGCADGLAAKKISDSGARYVLGIDVSEEFIRKAKAIEVRGKLEFRCTDAVGAAEGKYEVIFGRSILHHIDFQTALARFYNENLAKGGLMVFMEPLGANPLIRLYQLLARTAHTPDEKSFGRAELRWLRTHFPNVKIYAFNLVSFVAGLTSHMIFRSPDNPLLRISDASDEWLAKNLSVLRPYFRHCLVVIEKEK